MRKSFLWAIAACLTLTVACYDDSELQNKVDDLQTTVTKIESRVKDLESKVAGLQSIATLVENGYLVKSYEALSDGTGYTLTLVKGSETKVITIKNGVDGENGTTPSVTIEKKGDVYYWVINGVMTEYPVTGNDGKNGENGKTPQFKLVDGVWMVSFDGTTWEKVATEGFVPVSVSLTENNDGTVTLVVDGKSIVLPVAKDFAIKVTLESNNIGAGQTANATYTLTGVESGDEITVELFIEGPYKAEIIPGESNTEGKIAITAPDDIATGKIIVFAANGKGKADMKAIKVATVGKVETKTEAGIEITEALAVEAAGTDALKVNVVSNIDYAVATDADWVTWEIATKASHDDFVTFKVKANDGYKLRTATIKIVAASDANLVLQTLEIAQAGKPVTTIEALKTLAPTEITSTESIDFTATVTDAVVTYVPSKSQFFVQDATAGMFVYLNNHGLVAGTTINGVIKGKITRYNGQREVTSLDASAATITTGEIPAAIELTIAELNKNFDNYESMRIKLSEVTADADLEAAQNNSISQKENKTVLYIQKGADVSAVKEGLQFDVICFPYTFKDGTQEVKIWEASAISNIHAPKVLTLDKVWGIYGEAGVCGWPGKVSGIEDLDGNIRNATFDDDFVYIPKTKAVSADGNFTEYKIFKFKVSDGSYAGLVTPATDPAYMAGTWASTFPVSCARVMKNTDPAVNNGKDILVCTNLCDGQNVRLYAWINGVDQQPQLLTNFSSARRFGDRISVEGTYQDGRVWYRSFAGGMTAFINLVPGYTSGFNGSHAWNWVEALGATATDDGDSMITEYTSFNKGAFGIVSTNSGKGIYLLTGTATTKNYTDYKRCWGWHAFEYEGVNYIAYLDLSTGTDKPIVTVIEGASSTVAELQATLEAKKVVARAAFATADVNDFTTGTAYATNNVGECEFRVINGEPYILGATRGSIALFKFIWK